MQTGASFVNMAAILDGILTMFAVWMDGTVRDVRGEILETVRNPLTGQIIEGFDPRATPVVSRNSVQSAAIRSWKRGYANDFEWTSKIAAKHAAAGDHIHTLEEWMLGVEETRKGKTFTHLAGVITAQEDGATKAADLWAKVVEAYGLENAASAVEAA